MLSNEKRTISFLPFLLTGIITGSLLAYLHENTSIDSSFPSLWVSYYGLMFLLAYPFKQSLKSLCMTTLIVSLLASSVFSWQIDNFIKYSSTLSAFLLTLINAYALNALHIHYHQKKFKFEYAVLFDAVWDTVGQLLICLLFLILCWFLIFLTAGLFSVIGIKWIEQLINKSWFDFLSSAIYISMGLWIAEKTNSVVRNIKVIFLSMCRYLLIPISVLSLIYCPLLVIKNIQLYQQILISDSQFFMLVFLSLILINGVYQDGKVITPYPSYLMKLITIAIGVLSIFAIWGLYDIYFNNIVINKWNQFNYQFFISIFLLTGYAVSYAIIALRKESPWFKSIEKTNITLAIMLIVITECAFQPVMINKLAIPSYNEMAITPNQVQNKQVKLAQEKQVADRKQLLAALEKAGFKWIAASSQHIPTNAVVLGYDPKPIYACRALAQHAAGIVINQQCALINAQKINFVHQYTVLTGPTDKIVWSSTLYRDKAPHRPFPVYDTEAGTIHFCRGIYQGKIIAGLSFAFQCVAVANNKIITLNNEQAREFMYAKIP